jgi:DNA-binding response OmpR family regulator
MRLLVVEDEKKVASFIQQGLEEEGYAIDVASDGAEGLALVLERMHDLILLDICLPKMDGLQVLQALRQERVTTPVLLLTVRATIEEKVLGLDAGADDYLTKPFAFQELVARVRALLQRRPEATLMPFSEDFSGCRRGIAMSSGVIPGVTALPKSHLPAPSDCH